MKGDFQVSAFSDWCRSWSRWYLVPVARFFAKMGFTPNGVTLLGAFAYLLCGLVLGLGYRQLSGWMLAVLGPLDVVDGLLARERGETSRFGAFLDSSIDRFAEFFLFSGLLFYFHTVGELHVMNSFLVLSAMTGSLLVSYTRARAEALGFECRVGLLTRFERLFIFAVGLILGFIEHALVILALFSHFTAIQRMVHVWRLSRPKT